MTTTPVDLNRLLAAVDRATIELRSSPEVPPSVEALVDGLADLLHADSPASLGMDPYLASSLYAGALRSLEALRHDRAAARRSDLRVALEQVRQAIRDGAEGAPVGADVAAKDALRHLATTVTVTQPELAALLGVSVRQMQRWLAEDGPSPTGEEEARVRTVAAVANQLRHVFTGPGVAAWFTRPHPFLGKPPAELLGDPLERPRLLALATGARA